MAGKEAPPFGFRRSRRHSSLLVAHLESPNFTPRALIDAVPDETEHCCIVLTGPNGYFEVEGYCNLSYPRLYCMKTWIVSLVGVLIVGVTGDQSSHAQPVPIEFMAGQRYASANVVMSKKFNTDSNIGFFHVNSLTMDYDDKSNDNLVVQNMLFYELPGNFRITGGAAYATKPGFSPAAGLQYIHAGPHWFILFSPRITVESDPSYTMFAIARYAVGINEKYNFYASLQAVNVFDASEHITSSQWMRAGLDRHGLQFGVAVNFDEAGPAPKVKLNAGLFIRREIF